MPKKRRSTAPSIWLRPCKEEGIKPSSFHFIAFCLVFLYNIELESNIQEDFYADSHAYS